MRHSDVPQFAKSDYDPPKYRWLFFACALVLGIYATSLHSFLFFHALVETFCAATALCLFVIVWHTRHLNQNAFLQFVGFGYLFVALFDLLHMLSYQGMDVFGAQGANLPTQLWIASRYIASATFVIAALAIGRRWPPQAMLTGCALLTALLLASIFAGVFPDCYVRALTPFKVYSEYAISGLFLLALTVLYKQRAHFTPDIHIYLSLALLLNTGANLAFTAYINVFDGMNLLGHVLKFMAYVLLYKALVDTTLRRPIKQLFGDLKRNQEALEGERNFWTTVFGTAGALAIILDRQGRITSVNRAAERTTGYSAPELIGKALIEVLVPLDQRGGFSQVLAQIQVGAPAHLYETAIVARDGSPRLISWAITAMADATGQVEHIVNTGLDVTEARRAEKLRGLTIEILSSLNSPGQAADAIGAILQRIQATLKLSAVGIRLQDQGDFPYFVYSGLSSDFVRSENSLCHRKCTQKGSGPQLLDCLCGQVLSAQPNPELPCFTSSGSFWTNNTTELFTAPATAKLRTQIRGRCHKEGYQSVALIPLRSGPEIVGLLQLNDYQPNRFTPETIAFLEGAGASIGIALKRKQQEDALSAALSREKEARQQAELANRAKDEFLAMLSHELRTPLTAMLGWIRILRSDGDNAARMARGLEIIERNTRAQSRLIDDLLEVSRIVSGKLVLDCRPLDLVPTFEAALDAVRPQAESKGLRLESQADVQSAFVRGDPARLQQVINNLLTNAIKFTPAGGSVKAGLKCQGQCLRLSVQDSGIGIEPQFLPQVFDRFAQADISTTRKYQGLGLGLAIAKHLVELHGGSISVASEGKNRGALFSLELPLTAAPEVPEVLRQPSSSATQNPKAPRLQGVRVLIVEDEADAREVICAALQQYGAVANSAASVAEALQLFEQFKPDLLLSDIGLPGEDGYTLIKQVRTRSAERGGRIPAIALTAYAKHEDQARALAEGFQRHVSKPVEPQQLVELITTLLAARRV